MLGVIQQKLSLLQMRRAMKSKFKTITMLIAFNCLLALTEALALVGGTVHVHLGTDHCPKRYEHLSELRVTKLLGQVVDKQVAALGPDRDHCKQSTYISYTCYLQKKLKTVL